jgi:hypothetical protein
MEEEDIFDGEFSDLPEGEEEDGFGEEGMEEDDFQDFDDEDEMIDDPVEDLPTTTKAKPVEEKENVEVTQRFFEKLKGQLSKNPGAGSLKLFLQVFVDLLNDETKDRFRKRAFIITDLNLLNEVVKYGVGEFPAILIKAVGLK